jgi:2'-5' RNA ligase
MNQPKTTTRLFVAIPLPEEIQQEIIKHAGTNVPGVNWQTGKMHITLFFLGDQSKSQIIDILKNVTFSICDYLN